MDNDYIINQIGILFHNKEQFEYIHTLYSILEFSSISKLRKWLRNG